MNKKESYIVDAHVRQKKYDETCRQPENIDIVEEEAVNTFLDSCHESTDFKQALNKDPIYILNDSVTS